MAVQGGDVKKKQPHTPMQRPLGVVHPSGKPTRQPKCGVTSRPRVPFDGPLSPGLQRNGFTEAVGFTANLAADDFE